MRCQCFCAVEVNNWTSSKCFC